MLKKREKEDNDWFPELFDEEDGEDNQEVPQDRKQDYRTDQQEQRDRKQHLEISEILNIKGVEKKPYTWHFFLLKAKLFSYHNEIYIAVSHVWTARLKNIGFGQPCFEEMLCISWEMIWSAYPDIKSIYSEQVWPNPIIF